MIGTYEVLFTLFNKERNTSRTGSCKVVATNKREAVASVQSFADSKEWTWLDGEAYLDNTLEEVFDFELGDEKHERHARRDE